MFPDVVIEPTTLGAIVSGANYCIAVSILMLGFYVHNFDKMNIDTSPIKKKPSSTRWIRRWIYTSMYLPNTYEIKYSIVQLDFDIS